MKPKTEEEICENCGHKESSHPIKRCNGKEYLCKQFKKEKSREGYIKVDDVLKAKKIAKQCCDFQTIHCETSCLNWICPLNNNPKLKQEIEKLGEENDILSHPKGWSI